MLLRKRIITISLGLVVFLSGCVGKNSPSDKEKIIDYYTNLGTIRMNADIYADFDDHIASYGVEYTRDATGNASIKILNPESVRGITANIETDGCEIMFDNVRLEAGELDKDGLTPISAIPRLLEVWKLRDEQVSCQRVKISGTDAIFVVYLIENENNRLEYRSWFDVSTYHPLYSEIYVDGFRAVKCDYKVFEEKA